MFTNHSRVFDIEHQRIFEPVITDTRPMKGNGEVVETIITYETPSGTEWQASSDPKQFVSNLFIEVSEKDVETKIKVKENYEFEKRVWPHPRTPEVFRVLAKGSGAKIGYNSAEPFAIVRHVI